MKTIIALFAGLILTGCASRAVEFEAASGEGRPGYADTQIASDRYRVTFTGDDNAASDRVKDLALLRAAELTLLEQHDWFRVVSRESERQIEERPQARTTVARAPRVNRDCGLLGCTTTVSPGYGSITVGTTRSSNRLTSSIEILMGDGEVDDPASVYNASELRSFIRDKYDIDG